MKQILVLNSGSSSLKYQLIDISNEEVVAKGVIEKIGEESSIIKHTVDSETHVDHKPIANRADAMVQLMSNFAKFGPKLTDENLRAIGHRVVHGGEKFTSAVVIDDEILREIDELASLAMLHNPANTDGIRAAVELFPDLPQIAVFDTAFHSTMTPENYAVPIDQELARKHSVRRYGFHGTSHQFVAERAAKFLDQDLKNLNLITLHIGSGCSITAIRDGCSIATSMGLTPLGGLMMGTRSGDLDPGVIFHLVRAGVDLDEIEEMLNKKSGVIGMAGVNDMRDIVENADNGDIAAQTALNVFVERIRDFIGAYFVKLGHVDALVFTGGVGEKNCRVRADVLRDLDESLGVGFIPEINAKYEQVSFDDPVEISTPESRFKILIIPTNEELSIARQAAEILNL